MVGAMTCFVCNDALVKHVSASLPSAQLIFLRGVFASALVLLVAWRLGVLHRLPALLNPRVALRGAIDAPPTLYRDRKSTRLNSSHPALSRMPSSA